MKVSDDTVVYAEVYDPKNGSWEPCKLQVGTDSASHCQLVIDCTLNENDDAPGFRFTKDQGIKLINKMMEKI